MKTCIIVGVMSSLKNKEVDFLNFYRILNEKKLVVRTSRISSVIETPNAIIKFIYGGGIGGFRGHHCDISFGELSRREQSYLNVSGKPTEYTGSCLDYIFELEGVNI